MCAVKKIHYAFCALSAPILVHKKVKWIVVITSIMSNFVCQSYFYYCVFAHCTTSVAKKIKFRFWFWFHLHFSAYKTPGSISGRGQNIYNCDYGQEPPPGQVCDVDIKSWAPCVQENNYNYHRSAPCIFLKLNKIFGWVPHYYNDSTHLPGNMPDDLKKHVDHIEKNEHQTVRKILMILLCY